MKKHTEITADSLISVADYAKARFKSLSWAYKQIKEKKVKVKMIGKTTFIVGKTQSSNEPSSQMETFICKECKCEVPNSFCMRTIGYCYLCDPEITLEELLSDKPLPTIIHLTN